MPTFFWMKYIFKDVCAHLLRLHYKTFYRLKYYFHAFTEYYNRPNIIIHPAKWKRSFFQRKFFQNMCWKFHLVLNDVNFKSQVIILINELNLFSFMYNFELIKSMCISFLQEFLTFIFFIFSKHNVHCIIWQIYLRYINFIFIISLLHFLRGFI